MTAFIYILRCSNDKYYVGSTNDLERRLQEHSAGEGAKFTSKHLPVELVYYEEFQGLEEAYLREQQVKKWSRQKKEALINGELNKLKNLSSRAKQK